MSKSDQKTLNDIREYGCHVLGVLEGEEEPTFTYSIGIFETQGKPELLILGLDPKLAQSMVNQYNRLLKEGELFEAGKYYSGFLEGFDVCFVEVDKKYHNEYPLACNTHYGDSPYSVMQLIWPTTSGLWPWDENVSDFYLWSQPILNSSGVLEKI
ncbi:DUF4262 domain-containing protein [Teredinibacter turnerae]|uniref:DUF4262 domain-containing protein n=1 Tax=Teredinibacter turnerae TaxID=2426 RepID=UPI00035C166F|nr:DUF4262 domain-containing protein [Teredinibacter turnerae]